MKNASINIIGEDRCTGCFGCYNSCPHGAIDMALDPEGFLTPKINPSKCVDCGICQISCPVIQKAKSCENEYDEPCFFGGWISEKIVREASSSGGVFTAIAEKILDEGGAVFGAAFNEKYDGVKHIFIERKEDLSKLRGSKYVQSELGYSFREGADLAAVGRKVLFSGTPCQIAAFKTFLTNESRKNVLTCEVVCHGVPSQSVFRAYAEFLESKHNAPITGYNFRDKRNGWENYSYGINVSFANGKKFFKSNKEEKFMRGYLKNIYLRKSCYECPFTSLPRTADITLGDFWGVGRLNFPQVSRDDLKKGVSLIIANTEKGLGTINSIEKLKIFSVSRETVLANNADIFRHNHKKEEDKRKIFFDAFRSEGFESAIAKVIKKPSLESKLINFLKKMICF